VVATWTAETSLGLGLRLVIIQAEPVSNIANPTLESEVATRMTMKAELPSRPQRGSALDGVFGSRFDSVVKLSARYPDTVRPRDLRARIEPLWQASSTTHSQPGGVKHLCADVCLPRAGRARNTRDRFDRFAPMVLHQNRPQDSIFKLPQHLCRSRQLLRQDVPKTIRNARFHRGLTIFRA
jgi:hypothetical protein